MATDKVISFGELGTEPFGSNASGANKPTGVAPAPVVVASPVLSFLTSPGPWTYLKVQGQVSPGWILAGDLRGFERKFKWDVKAGKGTQGATTTLVGLEPSEGSITFSLPSEADIAAWSAFLALWRFDPTKGKGQAVVVYHPALASVQPPITSLVMTKHTPVSYDDKGCGKVTIDCLEYFPAKSTGATTAAGAKGYTQGKAATGTQEDPAITKLKAQAQQLANQLHGTA